MIPLLARIDITVDSVLTHTSDTPYTVITHGFWCPPTHLNTLYDLSLNPYSAEPMTLDVHRVVWVKTVNCIFSHGHMITSTVVFRP
jgi:hypothetical protein